MVKEELVSEQRGLFLNKGPTRNKINQASARLGSCCASRPRRHQNPGDRPHHAFLPHFQARVGTGGGHRRGCSWQGCPRTPEGDGVPLGNGSFPKGAGGAGAGAGLTSALYAWVAPEELLALSAGPASEARHALALPRELPKKTPTGDVTPSAARSCAGAKAKPSEHAPRSPHLVAGRPEGARGVAAALLAAGAAGEPPRVGSTAVTGLPHHVGEALALPRGRVAPAALRALAVLPDGAQVVADALCEGKSVMPRCQPALSLPDCPEFAFSLFSESPEVRADAGTSQHPWPGLADPTLNDMQHRTRALLMSQAGHLYGFCPTHGR